MKSTESGDVCALIKRRVEYIIETVKKYSKNQVKLWQQIPWWANQADGRTGWSDSYSRAIKQGYWALNCSIVNGYYNIYVDLENGILVSPIELDRPASDEHIFKLSFYLDEINAEEILESIKYAAQIPYGSYYDKADIERIENIRKYNLSEFKYCRKINKNEIEKAGLVN